MNDIVEMQVSITYFEQPGYFSRFDSFAKMPRPSHVLGNVISNLNYQVTENVFFCISEGIDSKLGFITVNENEGFISYGSFFDCEKKGQEPIEIVLTPININFIDTLIYNLNNFNLEKTFSSAIKAIHLCKVKYERNMVNFDCFKQINLEQPGFGYPIDINNKFDRKVIEDLFFDSSYCEKPYIICFKEMVNNSYPKHISLDLALTDRTVEGITICGKAIHDLNKVDIEISISPSDFNKDDITCPNCIINFGMINIFHENQKLA